MHHARFNQYTVLDTNLRFRKKGILWSFLFSMQEIDHAPLIVPPKLPRGSFGGFLCVCLAFSDAYIAFGKMDRLAVRPLVSEH
jgi:hypothetical protein